MRLYIIAALVLTGCATTYKGPGYVGITKLCLAQGHTMRTLAECQENALAKAYPNWRAKDEDAAQIDYLLTYAKTLGEGVSEGRISNDGAISSLKEESNRLYSQKVANRSQSAARDNAFNAMAVIAGSTLMMSSQPSFQQPAYIAPYPSDTTIIQQNARPYRFMDSAPYK